MSKLYSTGTKVIVVDWLQSIGTVVSFHPTGTYYVIDVGLGLQRYPDSSCVLKYTEIGKLLYV